MDGCLDGGDDGCKMRRWMEGCVVDGWMDECVGCWMDRWMGR